MNKWVNKSIKLANSRGYLDKLMEIYSIDQVIPRKISLEEKKIIKKALKRGNKKELISILLDFKKFPIDDPYIGFLRKNRKALKLNPKTISRIGKKLLSMSLGEILVGVSKPKSPSRQLGQMFRKWIYRKIGYPILSKEDFLKYQGIAILDGGDAALKKFAKDKLGYRGQKGLDIVLKTKHRFIIGEAKFITASGGGQDKGFRETIAFIKRNRTETLRIAILDGVVWLASDKTKMKKKKKLNLYDTVINLGNDKIALSALLLKDFIKEENKKI